MRLIYHPEAEAELVDAAEYYEERLTGLGAPRSSLHAPAPCLLISSMLHAPRSQLLCFGLMLERREFIRRLVLQADFEVVDLTGGVS